MDEMPKPRRRKGLQFESVIGAGQNPSGFVGQNANGTIRSGDHPGWNYDYKFPEAPTAPKVGPWKGANRTGE